MKRLVKFVPTSILATLLAGCLTRAYIGTGAPGVPSPDKSYRLTIRAYSALWPHQYPDKTKKPVYIGIWSGNWSSETNLFWKGYRFVGADLTWHVEWASSEYVSVYLFDYGEGLSATDARKSGTPSNHIAMLTYVLNKQTGKFVERR